MIDVKLDPGTIILPLTDGVYDDLPCHSQLSKDVMEQDYKETQLDASAMRALLSDIDAKAPVNTFVERIAEYAINQAEKKRVNALSASNASFHAKEEVDIPKSAAADSDQMTGQASASFFAESKTERSSTSGAPQDIQLGDDFALYGVRI